MNIAARIQIVNRAKIFISILTLSVSFGSVMAQSETQSEKAFPKVIEGKVVDGNDVPIANAFVNGRLYSWDTLDGSLESDL